MAMCEQNSYDYEYELGKSMSTDRHEVLLPINHNFNKICDIIGYF